MKKLMFFAFFLIAVGTYAQDHNSVRGRLNLIGSSGSDAFDLNLIRTGPDADKVVFSWARAIVFNMQGSFPGREMYTPNDFKGPTASFLIPNHRAGSPFPITQLDFRVAVLIEQKNMPMGDWPLEIWQIIIDLEPGTTSYRVEGVRIQ